MLITAEELHAHLSDPSLILFDCRHDLLDHALGARVYADGHLPGAHFAAVEADLSGAKTGANGRHPLPDPRTFADFLAHRGATPASTIVAYDDASGYAIRLWWLARWIGHTRVLVLDGGLPAWRAKGFPLTRAVPALRPQPVPYPARPGAMPVRRVDEVAANLTTPHFALLDARAGERYRGETEPVDPAAGHIPGALHRFHKTNVNADLTFCTPADLRREFLALLGDRRAPDVVHYCGSGITAAVNLFAMELAGLAGSQLYAGSWSEWSADRLRPVATGPA